MQFKVACTSNIGDMCIHSKMTVQCKYIYIYKYIYIKIYVRSVYDSLICNSHVDDIDAHVDDIIYVKYYRFVSITTHPYN